MDTAASPRRLIEILGGMYSRELRIDLSGPDHAQIFRWFLAAKLMGARISTRAALSTWGEFDRRGIDTPERIRQTGWDGLVAILDGKVVGTAGLHPVGTALRRRHAMELGICVAAPAQGHGVGKALMAALLSQQYQMSYVWLVTDPDTPTFFRITALWGSQEGSLLFWSWLLSGGSANYCGRWGPIHPYSRTARQDLPWVGIDKKTGRAQEWLPAVLLDKQLYLFDSELGLPLPGPGGRSIGTIALAAPVISSIDSPFIRSAVTSAAMRDGGTLPSIISRMTDSISSMERFCRSTNFISACFTITTSFRASV